MSIYAIEYVTEAEMLSVTFGVLGLISSILLILTAMEVIDIGEFEETGLIEFAGVIIFLLGVVVAPWATWACIQLINQ